MTHSKTIQQLIESIEQHDLQCSSRDLVRQLEAHHQHPGFSSEDMDALLKRLEPMLIDESSDEPIVTYGTAHADFIVKCMFAIMAGKKDLGDLMFPKEGLSMLRHPEVKAMVLLEAYSNMEWPLESAPFLSGIPVWIEALNHPTCSPRLCYWILDFLDDEGVLASHIHDLTTVTLNPHDLKEDGLMLCLLNQQHLAGIHAIATDYTLETLDRLEFDDECTLYLALHRYTTADIFGELGAYLEEDAPSNAYQRSAIGVACIYPIPQTAPHLTKMLKTETQEHMRFRLILALHNLGELDPSEEHHLTQHLKDQLEYYNDSPHVALKDAGEALVEGMIPIIHHYVDHHDIHTQLIAWRTLSQMNYPSLRGLYLEPLRECFADEYDRDLFIIARGLAQLVDESLSAFLLDAIIEEDASDTTALFAHTLAERQDHTSLRPLVEHWRTRPSTYASASSFVIFQLQRAVVSFGAKGCLVAAQVDAQSTDTADHDERLFALFKDYETLGFDERTTEAYIALTNTDAWRRYETHQQHINTNSTTLLSDKEKHDIAFKFERAVAHSEEAIALALLEGVQTHKVRKTEPFVLQLLNTTTDENIQLACIKALGLMGSHDSVGPVLALLNEEEWFEQEELNVAIIDTILHIDPSNNAIHGALMKMLRRLEYWGDRADAARFMCRVEGKIDDPYGMFFDIVDNETCMDVLLPLLDLMNKQDTSNYFWANLFIGESWMVRLKCAQHINPQIELDPETEYALRMALAGERHPLVRQTLTRALTQTNAPN